MSGVVEHVWEGRPGGGAELFKWRRLVDACRAAALVGAAVRRRDLHAQRLRRRVLRHEQHERRIRAAPASQAERGGLMLVEEALGFRSRGRCHVSLVLE